MSLLTIEQLSVYFQNDKTRHGAVEALSLHLDRGEFCALVGESGSGKSVTALSVLRLLSPQTTIYAPDSRIIFDGVDLLTCSEPDLRAIRGRRISMIFQEPMSALNPFMNIGAQLMEAVRAHQPRIAKKVAREKIIALLQRVKIDAPEMMLRRYPHECSGGQLQRIMIAMVLLNQPDILIADEPTTALDVTIQAEILYLLQQLQQELSMAVLLITHDLHLARHYAQRVYVMQAGKLVETGTVAQIFTQPQQDYTRILIKAVPQTAPAPLQNERTILVQAHHVRVDFMQRKFLCSKQRFCALEDVSFTLPAGTTLGVVGESGSGKTTLGKALLQMVPYRGDVFFLEKNIAHLTADERQRLKADRQVVFQDPMRSLSPRLTVGEIVGEGLRVHAPELSAKARRDRVAAALAEVGLTAEMMQRYPHAFSGGQRQRIAIARAMILQPKFIVLDEPTSALDRVIQMKILELLRDLQSKYGLSYLFISHDLAMIRALSHQVLVLQRGKVVERGTTEAIFSAPQMPYTQRLLASALY